MPNENTTQHYLVSIQRLDPYFTTQPPSTTFGWVGKDGVVHMEDPSRTPDDPLLRTLAIVQAVLDELRALKVIY